MILNKYFEENKGLLVPIEFKNLPFEPKRIFFVTNVPKNVERGNHAHYSTQQILICIKGKIEVKLYDGKIRKSIIINEGESVFVDKFIWDSQIFLTGNDTLLVLCSTEYDINDYIFDIENLEKMINKL